MQNKKYKNLKLISQKTHLTVSHKTNNLTNPNKINPFDKK